MGFGYPSALDRPLWLFNYHGDCSCKVPRCINRKPWFPPMPPPDPKKKCKYSLILRQIQQVLLEIRDKRAPIPPVSCNCQGHCTCRHTMIIEKDTSPNPPPPLPPADDCAHLREEYRRAMDDLAAACRERDHYFRKYTSASAEAAALRASAGGNSNGGGQHCCCRGGTSTKEESKTTYVVDNGASARLQAECEALRSENRRLQDELERSRRAVEEGKQREIDAQDLIRSLRHDLEVSKRRGDEAAELARNLRAERDDLARRCADLEEKLRSRQAEIGKLNRDAERLGAALDEARRALDAAQMELRLCKLNKPPPDNRVTPVDTSAAVSAIRDVAGAVGRAADGLRMPASNCNCNCKAPDPNADRELKRLEAKCDRLRRKLDESRRAAEDARAKHRAERRELQAMIDDLRARIRQQQQPQPQPQPQPQARRDEGEVEKLRARIATLSAELRAAREELERMRAERDAARAQAGSLSSQVDELQVYIDNHTRVCKASAYDRELVELTKGLIENYRHVYETRLELEQESVYPNPGAEQ